MKELGADVAGDGQIDLMEFLRLFSWHDIDDVSQAISASRLKV